MAKANEILRRPYSRLLVCEEDGGFSARVVELSGCFAEGDTAAEAATNLEAAAESWLEAALSNDCDIPEPSGDNEYSGKFILRVPRSLHRRCALLAQYEGVSLNQYVVSILAQHAGEKKAENKLAGVVAEVERLCRVVVERIENDATHPMKRMARGFPASADQTGVTRADSRYACAFQ